MCVDGTVKITVNGDKANIDEIDKGIINRFRWNWLEKSVIIDIGTKEPVTAVRMQERRRSYENKEICSCPENAVNKLHIAVNAPYCGQQW